MANDLQIKLPSERTGPEIARDTVHALESYAGFPSDLIKVEVKYGVDRMVRARSHEGRKLHHNKSVVLSFQKGA